MEYTNSQVRELIGEHIHSRRDREIMTLRLIEGLTYEQLAEKVDMSTIQVKRIVHREQTRIFKLIQ